MARAVQELQDATDLIDERAARHLGINRTDLRCLSRITARGPLTATELASAAGITGGATTTAVDRLERAGLARRVRDPDDRRRVRVELTDHAHQRIEEIWGPLRTDAGSELAGYAATELELIERFLRGALHNQRHHAERLAAPPDGRG